MVSGYQAASRMKQVRKSSRVITHLRRLTVDAGDEREGLLRRGPVCWQTGQKKLRRPRSPWTLRETLPLHDGHVLRP